MLSSPEGTTKKVRKETPDNLQLVALAKDRANNGRRGAQALETILENHNKIIETQIDRRIAKFPMLAYEDLYASAVEGAIRRVDQYDSTKGRLNLWVYYGIQSGLDIICEDSRRYFKANSCTRCFSEEKYTLRSLDEVDPFLLETSLALVAKLNPDIKKIITLVSQGWRFTEIATRYGKSADAVRMAYNRGIASLKAAMESNQAPRLHPQDIRPAISHQ